MLHIFDILIRNNDKLKIINFIVWNKDGNWSQETGYQGPKQLNGLLCHFNETKLGVKIIKIISDRNIVGK